MPNASSSMGIPHPKWLNMVKLIQILELIFPIFAKCMKFFKTTVLGLQFYGAQSQKFNMEPAPS